MMRKICLTVLFILLATSNHAQAYAEGPVQMLKRTHKTINRLLKEKATPGSALEKKNKEKMKKTINAFLDFSELAKLSLGKHWDARSEKERDEFVEILKDLIERNYIKQLKNNLGYKLEYKNEKVIGDSALVATVVRVEKDGRTTEVSIDYQMRKTSKGWMVYDVITDEVSIVKNYRSQFNRIIRKDSYQALVKKMQQKLHEES
jgi:phospholipid transport system substrate-binding protein